MSDDQIRSSAFDSIFLEVSAEYMSKRNGAENYVGPITYNSIRLMSMSISKLYKAVKYYSVDIFHAHYAFAMLKNNSGSI